MTATTFTYDGISLSSYGCIICQFDDDAGPNTTTAGSDLTFTTVKLRHNGSKYFMADSIYNSCYETTFCICKDACSYTATGSVVDVGLVDVALTDDDSMDDDVAFTVDEYAEIMRWLNRSEFHDFTLDDDSGWADVVFHGTFTVKKVEFCDRIVGFELTFVTDSPFGYKPQESYTFTIENAGDTYTIEDSSDEIGDIYPDSMVIQLNGSGTLTITNSLNNLQTTFYECTSGEVISFDDTCSYVESSTGRNLCNYFNYKFFRLSNTFRERDNILTFTLPCTVTLTYTPFRKAVF